MQSTNRGKVNFDRGVLNRSSQESGKEAQRPFIGGPRRATRMQLAQLRTKVDELPLARCVRSPSRVSQTVLTGTGTAALMRADQLFQKLRRNRHWKHLSLGR